MARIAPVLSAALAALLFAGSAAAQVVEPWRSPTSETAPNRAHVTSSEGAAQPSAAEQREARALAVAVFGKRAAAQKAADKVAAANTPAIPPAEPKPEWLAKDGLQAGGKGMKVTTPF